MFTTQIEKFIFPLPPLEEQQALAKMVAELLERKQTVSDNAAITKKHLETMDECILSKAFRGELVPQDKSDEPASVLMARKRSEASLKAARKGGSLKRGDSKSRFEKDDGSNVHAELRKGSCTMNLEGE
jgi:type I restriction enzyme S subunit